MRKTVTLLLAAMMIGSTPVFAADVEADAAPTQLPKVLTDLGITSQDLKDVDKAILDTPTSQETGIMRHRQRYCPRGYRLEAYRIRIGRFVIVRYRCVRNHHRGHWDMQEQPAQEQFAPEQNAQ